VFRGAGLYPPRTQGQPGGWSLPQLGRETRPFYPTITRSAAALRQIEPFIQALGRSGYRVTPEEIVSIQAGMTAQDVYDHVLRHIDERLRDYSTLIRRIEQGDLSYLHFEPVLDDLLPLADADVRREIEIERVIHDVLELGATIAIGAATIVLLLATVFPPTSALGIAGLGALELGLGGTLLFRGSSAVSTGSAYTEGTGAHDVFTPQQQESGAALVVGGYLEMFSGGLTVVGGALRLGSLRSPAPAGSALTTTGRGRGAPQLTSGERTVTQGPWTATQRADGAVHITHADRPDLIAIARAGRLEVYQRGPGFLRLLESRTVPPASPAGGAGRTSALALPAGSGRSAAPSTALARGSTPRALLPPGQSAPATGSAVASRSGGWRAAQVRGRLGELTRFQEVGRSPRRFTSLFPDSARRQQIYTQLETGQLSLREFGRMTGPNGVEQMYFRTSLGGRYIDHVFPASDVVVLRESKNVSDFTLSSSYARQLAKDMELLNSYPEAVVHWRISGNGVIDEHAYRVLDAIRELTGGRFRFQLQDSAVPPFGPTSQSPTIH
jgi:hypothetical protein